MIRLGPCAPFLYRSLPHFLLGLGNNWGARGKYYRVEALCCIIPATHAPLLPKTEPSSTEERSRGATGIETSIVSKFS